MLKLNLAKCSILSVKRKVPILYDYYIKENTRDMQLKRCGKVKDLGVIIDSKLTFQDHITQKVNKEYAIPGIIQRNFDHI